MGVSSVHSPEQQPSPEITGLLQGTNLTIAYGTHTVIHDASLHLQPGTVTALVGPNGSGKSTLLRSLSRLHSPNHGTITLNKTTPINSLSAKEFARQITLLSQARPTPAGLTVHDVVEFGRHPHRHGWRGTDPHGPDAVKRALALTGIAPLAHHHVDTLSGGQLQRVWFASALAQNTSILLLDEPTNHLDLRYQVEILQLMRQLADAHSITVGVVLHDLNHAAAVADTVLVLDQGQVVAEGPPHLAFTSDLLTTVYDIDVVVTHTTPTTVTVSTPTTLTLRAQPRAHTNQPAPVC